MNKDDWRLLRGQDAYLSGAVLIKQSYKPSNKNNDHDHCEFCMDKFCVDADGLHFGYSTLDRGIWICPQCFEDFKEQFHWKVKTRYNMKKKLPIIIISVVGALLLIRAAVWVGAVALIATSQVNTEETFLESSVSPDGEYTLEAYRTSPGATADFSVKVYAITDGEKELIYNAYHEDEADISWLGNGQVSINGKELDLSKNETYDWR